MTEVTFQEIFLGNTEGVLRQNKDENEWFYGLEFPNRYELHVGTFPPSLALAQRQGNLREMRGQGQNFLPIDAILPDGEHIFSIVWRNETSILGPDNKPLGKILVDPEPYSKRYLIHDNAGVKIGVLVRGELAFGPFTLFDSNGTEIAAFEKQGGGQGRGWLKDADNYDIRLSEDFSDFWLPFLFGAILMVDFDKFETENAGVGLLPTLRKFFGAVQDS